MLTLSLLRCTIAANAFSNDPETQHNSKNSPVIATRGVAKQRTLPKVTVLPTPISYPFISD